MTDASPHGTAVVDSQIENLRVSPGRTSSSPSDGMHQVKQEDHREATKTTKPTAPMLFICPFPGCGKEFQLKGNWKRHQSIHKGEKKFMCQFCGKAFLRKADMEVHCRVHTGEKPYKCKYDNCDKCFARRSDLLSHERTHIGSKPFTCPFPGCGRSFARKFDLNKHQRLHDNESSSSCHKKKRKLPSLPASSSLSSSASSCCPDDCNQCAAWESENKSDSIMNRAEAICSSLLTESKPIRIGTPTVNAPVQYNLVCTEDHGHSPPACFEMFTTVDSLDDFLSAQEPIDIKRPLDTCLTESYCLGNDQQSSTPLEPLLVGEVTEAIQQVSSRDKLNTDESACASGVVPQPPVMSSNDLSIRSCVVGDGSSLSTVDVPKLLNDYSKHNRSCGHLSIQHGNHRDYVVKNHLVCQDSVKSISIDNATAKCAMEKDASHRPGCGHLAVRHIDHIDYVVEDNLFCQYAGFLEDADNIELLDDDFWDFYGAIGSLNND